MSSLDLHNSQRRALVTGGAHGIGWAICRDLAGQGYLIALADIDAKVAAARVAALGDGHHAIAVDLLNADDAAGLPERAAALMGGLDVIVNNAGMTDTAGKPLIDLPDAAFQRLVALNLTAVTEICTASPKVLKPGSAIINLSSGAAFRPLALRGPYSATKAGVTALTKYMAQDFAPLGIAVTAIAPGYTLTPLVQDLAREGRVDLEKVSASIPMGRIARPEDIASVVGFCASPKGAAFSGETLGVDGGGLMGAPTQGTAPKAGTQSEGTVAVLGATETQKAHLPRGTVALSSVEKISEVMALAGVVDLAPVDHVSPAALLEHSRAVALACAANAVRTEDFALLYIAQAPESAQAWAATEARAMLARTLALEWATAGLRVNALSWHGDDPAALFSIADFLNGPKARFVTGLTIGAGHQPDHMT